MSVAIKRNQIWKQKGHDMTIIISGKSGSKWRAKVLSDKPNIYKGSHTFNEYTLRAKYDLQS